MLRFAGGVAVGVLFAVGAAVWALGERLEKALFLDDDEDFE